MRVTQAPSSGAHRIGAAIALTVAFNLFTVLVFTLSSYARGPEDFQEALLISLPMQTVDGFIGFQIYFLLRWTTEFRQIPRFALVALAVTVIALVEAAWDTQLRIWFDTMSQPYAQAFVRSATLNMYNTGMLAALLAFQAAYAELKDKQDQLDQARASEREAQMLALRFQLNPHFLFNTLNAISGLVVTGRGRDAESMIGRLSSFLRGSLTADPDRMVAVEDEFEMLDNYLGIESVRFGERLRTIIDLPEALRDAQVPPFLLQPLVENAVKYAVAPSRSPVTIAIRARQTGGRIELEVCDTGGDGDAGAPGTGVGLANVRERLRLSYGAEGRIDAHAANGGYVVTLSMPLVRRLTASLTIAA